MTEPVPAPLDDQTIAEGDTQPDIDNNHETIPADGGGVNDVETPTNA